MKCNHNNKTQKQLKKSIEKKGEKKGAKKKKRKEKGKVPRTDAGRVTRKVVTSLRTAELSTTKETNKKKAMKNYTNISKMCFLPHHQQRKKKKKRKRNFGACF